MAVNRTFSLKHDLLWLNLFTLLLVLVIVLNQYGWLQVVRVIFGLPFVLFSPGYALTAALFAGRRQLDGAERVALSFGLSLAVVPLVALGLNYTPWGIRPVPVLTAEAMLVFLLSAVAFYRRSKLGGERFTPVFRFALPKWSEMDALDRVLAVPLALAVVLAVASVFYAVNTPLVGQQLTEFYLLGPSGQARDYPVWLQAGQTGQVIVGVVNHEDERQTYYVRVVSGGRPEGQTGPIQLKNGQKWEQKMSFSASTPTKNLEVDFLLYRQGSTQPYRSLHLWVNVAPVAGSAPSASG